jgi:hypothetical protein
MSLLLLHFSHILYVLPSPSKQFLPPEFEIQLSRLKTFPKHQLARQIIHVPYQQKNSYLATFLQYSKAAVIWTEVSELASWVLAN